MDWCKIETLAIETDSAASEEILCRAAEELSIRFTQAQRLMKQQDWVQLGQCLRSIRTIADQIGLDTLISVSVDAAHCIDTGDRVALSATLARLARVGPCSLSELWRSQGLSV